MRLLYFFYKKLHKIFLILFLSFLGINATGCAEGIYLASQSGGQIKIMRESVLIEDTLKNRYLDAKRKNKLLVVKRAREYATKELGYTPDKFIYPYIKRIPVLSWFGFWGGSYTAFYNNETNYVAWNVTASPKDSLTPKTWSFPIFGDVPYLGYFDKKDALKTKKALEKEGYDVSLSAVEAYSGAGWIRDPVFSTMLKNSDYRLVYLLYHEMTHTEIYSPGNANFNETAATFLGEVGAIEFFNAEGDYAAEKILQQEKADADLFNQIVMDVVTELNILYSEKKSGKIDEWLMLLKKEKIFLELKNKVSLSINLGAFYNPQNYTWVKNWKINNASLLSFVRYRGDIQSFRELHVLCGKSVKKTIKILKTISASKDPSAELEKILKNGLPK